MFSSLSIGVVHKFRAFNIKNFFLKRWKSIFCYFFHFKNFQKLMDDPQSPISAIAKIISYVTHLIMTVLTICLRNNCDNLMASFCLPKSNMKNNDCVCWKLKMVFFVDNLENWTIWIRFDVFEIKNSFFVQSHEYIVWFKWEIGFEWAGFGCVYASPYFLYWSSSLRTFITYWIGRKDK